MMNVPLNMKLITQYLKTSFNLLSLILALSFSACGSSPQVESIGDSSLQQTQAKPKETSADSAPEVLTNESAYQALKVLPYPQYTIASKYGEEQRLGVHYFNEQERNKTKLQVKNGLLYDSKGQKLDPELDNPEYSGRSGKAIFVISLDGQFWVTFDQRYGYIHHSSLLAAAPVLSAGELMIEEGQLLSISNASGHYKPAALSLDVALKLLKEQGVDLSECERFNINAAGIKVREQNTKTPNELLKNLTQSKSE